jgi:hypothetical protein
MKQIILELISINLSIIIRKIKYLLFPVYLEKEEI